MRSSLLCRRESTTLRGTQSQRSACWPRALRAQCCLTWLACLHDGTPDLSKAEPIAISGFDRIEGQVARIAMRIQRRTTSMATSSIAGSSMAIPSTSWRLHQWHLHRGRLWFIGGDPIEKGVRLGPRLHADVPLHPGHRIPEHCGFKSCVDTSFRGEASDWDLAFMQMFRFASGTLPIALRRATRASSPW